MILTITQTWKVKCNDGYIQHPLVTFDNGIVYIAGTVRAIPGDEEKVV